MADSTFMLKLPDGTLTSNIPTICDHITDTLENNKMKEQDISPKKTVSELEEDKAELEEKLAMAKAEQTRLRKVDKSELIDLGQHYRQVSKIYFKILDTQKQLNALKKQIEEDNDWLLV